MDNHCVGQGFLAVCVPAVVAAAREPEMVAAVLAARRGGVGQPHDAARLLAHLHLAGAAAAAAAVPCTDAARHLLGCYSVYIAVSFYG